MAIVSELPNANPVTGATADQEEFNKVIKYSVEKLRFYGIGSSDLTSEIKTSLEPLATQTNTISIDDNVETSIFIDDIGDKTIQANYAEVGMNFKINLFGNISTNESAETLIIKVKLGSTTLLTSPTSTLPNSLINKLFKADINISCRSIGATGTVFCHGCIEIDNGSNGFYQIPLVTASAQTIDTTASQELDITAQFSLATGNVLNVNFGQLRKI